MEKMDKFYSRPDTPRGKYKNKKYNPQKSYVFFLNKLGTY